MDHVQTRALIEQRCGQVQRIADARRSVSEFGTRLFRILHQLAHRLDPQPGIDHEDMPVGAGDLRHRRKIAQRVERQLLVDGGIDGKRAGRHQQRVAIRRGFRHEVGGNDAVGAGPIVHHELLVHLSAELRRQNACRGVGPARAEANDDANRTHRVFLRRHLRCRSRKRSENQ